MPNRIIFPSPGRVRLEPFEVRPPNADEIVVATRYSLMSIGTETTILHAKYDAGTHFAARFKFPQIKTGVQSIGVVDAVGAAVTEFRVGDPIFMRMAHTSHATLAAAQCSSVPADLEQKSACWCGLAKTAFRAAHAAPFRLGLRALIIGAGPVGQMAVRWARAAGAQAVVVDVAPVRLALARAGGAAHCLEGSINELLSQLTSLTEGAGFEVVVDTTGNPAVFTAALAAAAQFGRVVLLGDTGYPARQCLTSDMMTKGLTVVATHDHHDRDGWTQRRIDALFFELVRGGHFDLRGLITHEFAPADCEAAYALASDRRSEAVGILFDWTQGGARLP
jgi:2-desacetyl-2-hydroxyethyl bacteriochlorophyllide A dehydrogenase